MSVGQLGQGREVVRLFPLSETVLLPCSWLPLHIFEPRYRQMTEDALQADRRIAIVLPRDPEAPDPVPIHSIGCIGSIFNEKRLPDGRFLLLLKGEQRIRVISEIGSDRMYRRAEVDFLRDYQSPKLSLRRKLQRADILHRLRHLLPNSESTIERFLSFLQYECDSTTFADVIGFSAPITVQQKQQLLEEPSVDRRLEILSDLLRETLSDPMDHRVPFPPPFGIN